MDVPFDSYDVSNLFDGDDLMTGLMVAVLAIAFVLILLPIILFGIELIIVGFLLAIGIVGSTLFGRPWTVVAKSSDGRTGEWRIRGSRASSALIERICADLQSGGELPADFSGATQVL